MAFMDMFKSKPKPEPAPSASQPAPAVKPVPPASADAANNAKTTPEAQPKAPDMSEKLKERKALIDDLSGDAGSGMPKKAYVEFMRKEAAGAPKYALGNFGQDTAPAPVPAAPAAAPAPRRVVTQQTLDDFNKAGEHARAKAGATPPPAGYKPAPSSSSAPSEAPRSIQSIESAGKRNNALVEKALHGYQNRTPYTPVKPLAGPYTEAAQAANVQKGRAEQLASRHQYTQPASKARPGTDRIYDPAALASSEERYDAAQRANAPSAELREATNAYVGNLQKQKQYGDARVAQGYDRYGEHPGDVQLREQKAEKMKTDAQADTKAFYEQMARRATIGASTHGKTSLQAPALARAQEYNKLAGVKPPAAPVSYADQAAKDQASGVAAQRRREMMAMNAQAMQRRLAATRGTGKQVTGVSRANVA